MESIFGACKKGNTGEIRKWLKDGGTVDVTEEKTGSTPLMLVAEGKKEPPFRLVLKATSNEYLHKLNHNGENVLFFACRSGMVGRVRTLFVDKKVKVVRSPETGFAAELTTNQEIVQLLHADTQRLIDIHTSQMMQHLMTAKTLGDVYEGAKEFGKRTGLHMSVRQISPGEMEEGMTWKVEEMRPKLSASILSSETTRTELKEDLDVERPRSLTTARYMLADRYGVSVTKEETKAVLESAGVSTQRDLLRSLETRKALGVHFKAHPPATVKETVAYLRSTYSCECEPSKMQRFLRYFGIEVPLGE